MCYHILCKVKLCFETTFITFVDKFSSQILFVYVKTKKSVGTDFACFRKVVTEVTSRGSDDNGWRVSDHFGKDR
jgi:hypothetical protein